VGPAQPPKQAQKLGPVHRPWSQGVVQLNSVQFSPLQPPLQLQTFGETQVPL